MYTCTYMYTCLTCIHGSRYNHIYNHDIIKVIAVVVVAVVVVVDTPDMVYSEDHAV